MRKTTHHTVRYLLGILEELRKLSIMGEPDKNKFTPGGKEEEEKRVAKTIDTSARNASSPSSGIASSSPSSDALWQLIQTLEVHKHREIARQRLFSDFLVLLSDSARQRITDFL